MIDIYKDLARVYSGKELSQKIKQRAKARLRIAAIDYALAIEGSGNLSKRDAITRLLAAAKDIAL